MNSVQKAGLAELDPLIDLFDAYRVFYQKNSDKGAARDFIRQRMEKNESVIFVTFNEMQVMTGFVQLYPLFSSTRMRRIWLLNDLFVDPGFRGQGISLLLIETCQQYCRETNACGLMLETAKTNTIGNQLYPRTGFELDQEHNYYTWDNNLAQSTTL